MWQERQAGVLQNAFSTRVKLIWPRSSLKTTKMSKKRIFLQKAPVVNGLNNKILNQEYHQKYWSGVLQTWHKKYKSQEKQNDTCYVAAMTRDLVPVSFYEKPNIPICNLLKLDRGSSSEHIWFLYCRTSLH